MSKLIVGFSRPKKFFSPFSWFIRLFDQTPYSHTYIKFHSCKYDRWLIYQASSTLVNFFGPEAWAERAVVVKEFELEVSDEVMNKTVVFAIDRAGRSYDLKAVLGILVVGVAGLFGHKMANPFNDKNAFFCSELVGEILIEVAGENIRGELSTLTPRDIYEYLESRAA